MFGVEKRVERVRAALVQALKSKGMAIMNAHAAVDPSKIPWIDVARATILTDLADIIQNLQVQKQPGEDEP
jgi:hypothetical protein